MKKVLVFALSASLIMSLCACSNSNLTKAAEAYETTSSAETSASNETTKTEAPVKESVSLTNKMTTNELEMAEVRDLTLLDPAPEVATETATHKVQIELITQTIDELIETVTQSKTLGYITEDEYEEVLDYYSELKENDSNYKEDVLVGALVDGKLHYEYLCPMGYDGGSLVASGYDIRGNYYEIEFDNMENYLSWVYEDCLETSEDEEYSKAITERTRAFCEAVINNDYEILDPGTIDYSNPSICFNNNEDHRDKWEYSKESLQGIKDSIREISLYDEELGTTFLAHVILPPNYDSTKKYPVMLLTDAVWRLGDAPMLYEAMKEGKASDVIIVTLGYDYSLDGSDEPTRYNYFVNERALFLDFITDNLMPYLGTLYDIDYSSSTLFGHSDGGVFAHFALFNSDMYENQPFGNYIIGSPAFFGVDDKSDLMDDYGYFTRNEALKKNVFLCGGSQEDPDYEDIYEDDDQTTLEGIKSLDSRIEAGGVANGFKYECRLYESHHYQYIPEMLLDYLCETYPV